LSKSFVKAPLQPDDHFEDAMCQILADQWSRFWEAVPQGDAIDDPEAIHDVRVASRRLRAAMDISVDVFPQKWFRKLHKTARKATGKFGAVRDADVQIADLNKLRSRANPDELLGIDELTAQIVERRAEARSELIEYLKKLQKSKARKQSIKRFNLPVRGKKRS
jgi:CHAD domain-containing protein